MTYYEQKACANCKHAVRSGDEVYLWLCSANASAPVYGHAICERHEARDGASPSPLVYATPGTLADFLRNFGFKESEFVLRGPLNPAPKLDHVRTFVVYPPDHPDAHTGTPMSQFAAGQQQPQENQ